MKKISRRAGTNLVVAAAALFAVLVCAGVRPALAQGGEWTQWRGANRDGHAGGDFAPPAAASWPKELTRVWKTTVGAGYSSPLISKSRVYLHTRHGQEEVVSCIDFATGKTLWSKSYAAPSFKDKQQVASEGEGPYATPVLDAGKLYTLGVNAVLSCFDAATGELKWRKDFSNLIVSKGRFCGTASSPLVAGSLVVVHVGDDRASEIIALDKETGAPRWTHKDEAVGYSSPVVAEFGGVRQLVALTDTALVGVSLDEGQRLWSTPYVSSRDGCSQNVATPVIHENRIILSAAQRGVTAFGVTRERGVWATRQAWHNRDASATLSTPVLQDNFLYGFSHLKKGQFFCLDARTGETVWLSEGRQGDNASALASAGGALLFLTSDGNLHVAKTRAKNFETLARYTVADSTVWAHPALTGKHVLVRDSAALTLWSVK